MATFAAIASCGGGASSSSSAGSSGSRTVVAVSSVAAAPSAGCQLPAADRPIGTTTTAFDSEGLAGTYIQHVPSGYVDRPLPLVLDLHGYSETAALQADVSHWDDFGDRHGLIAVTPEITRVVELWDTALGSKDLAWMAALIRTVEAKQCVDRNRVFADGYSDGAFMVSAMACQLSAQVAAVAPVAGIQAVKGCKPSRPVPVVAFHGTSDPFVSYGGGLGPAALALPAPNGHGTLGSSGAAGVRAAPGPPGSSIPDQAAAWARRNKCGRPPMSRTVAAGVTLFRYPCAADATVELYRIKGGGHAWPGSPFTRSIANLVGFTTFAISADDVIWAFFEAHPLSPPISR